MNNCEPTTVWAECSWLITVQCDLQTCCQLPSLGRYESSKIMSFTCKGAFNNERPEGHSPVPCPGATNCFLNLASALAHGGTLMQEGLRVSEDLAP